MGAKITLTGAAKDILHYGRIISFRLVTGPATEDAPKGLELFGPVTYWVQCTQRQWNRAFWSPDDHSDLVIEGFQEPRRDPGRGKLSIAVVATSVTSQRKQNERKLAQAMQALDEVKAAFREAAKERGAPRVELEQEAEAFVEAQESVKRFGERHPELTGPK